MLWFFHLLTNPAPPLSPLPSFFHPRTPSASRRWGGPVGGAGGSPPEKKTNPKPPLGRIRNWTAGPVRDPTGTRVEVFFFLHRHEGLQSQLKNRKILIIFFLSLLGGKSPELRAFLSDQMESNRP